MGPGLNPSSCQIVLKNHKKYVSHFVPEELVVKAGACKVKEPGFNIGASKMFFSPRV